MFRAAVALTMLVCLTGLLPSASADEAGRAAYEELVSAAISAQASGDFTRSYGLFQQAFTAYPNARALRGMGVSAFQAGLFAASVRALRGALVHPEKPLDPELKKAVLDLLPRAEAEVASFGFSIQPVDPEIRVEDDPTAEVLFGELALMPGKHTLRFEAAGFEPYSLEVFAQRGTRDTIRVVMVPKTVSAAVAPSEPPSKAGALRVRLDQQQPGRPSHAWRRPAAWITGATSAGAAAASVGVWLLAKKRYDDIVGDCRSRPLGECPTDQAQKAWERAHLGRLNRTLLATQITAFTLAASALSLGASLWIRPIGERRMQVSLAPSGATVSGQF